MAGQGDAGLVGYDWFHDTTAFGAVYKMGLGDIDLSVDGSTLRPAQSHRRPNR